MSEPLSLVHCDEVCIHVQGVGKDEPLPVVKGLAGSSRDHSLHQLEIFFSSLSTAISQHNRQTLVQLKEILKQVHK